MACAAIVCSKYSRGKTSHYGKHVAVSLKTSSFVNALVHNILILMNVHCASYLICHVLDNSMLLSDMF